MRAWIAYLWERVHGSLWFVPGIMALAAAALAIGSGRVDDLTTDFGAFEPWLFHGDPEATRTLYATVAGSMITVAGVSYSITMVAMSLASSQLGPQLLRNFRRDRGNQVVLGAFIATFLYCLMALWTGTAPEVDEYQPSVSASLALLLATGSLFLLIYFIHHISLSIQADHVIDQVSRELRESLAKAFPECPEQELELLPDGADDAESGARVRAAASGYLQSVDEERLVRLACDHDLQFVVLRRPGHFLMESGELVKVLRCNSLDARLERRVRRSFIIGGRRTADQDPEQGIAQLVEVAVRALSPSLNDPFTAITCVDRLSGALGRAAAHPARPAVRCDHNGVPRVRFERIDFAGIVSAAFDQIRQFSHQMPAVAIRLVEACGRIADCADDPQRRALLAHQARLVLQASAGSLQSDDLAVLRDRYAKLLAGLDQDRGDQERSPGAPKHQLS
jgi:uncharacterized membrane protein